jgi:chromosome segregation ATPase
MVKRKPKAKAQKPSLAAQLRASHQLREQLEAEISDLRKCNEHARMELKAAQQGGTDLRTKLDDVKARLQLAETEVQRQRGYIERVQEDDIVREELVTTGEPEGAQQLVPKRKFTPAPAYMDIAINNGRPCFDGGDHNQRREKSKPWVTY